MFNVLFMGVKAEGGRRLKFCKQFVVRLAYHERNPQVSVNDDLHTLLFVSDGSHLIHDFLFTDCGVGRPTADEAVK